MDAFEVLANKGAELVVTSTDRHNLGAREHLLDVALAASANHQVILVG